VSHSTLSTICRLLESILVVKKASWKPIFDLRAVTGADGKPTTKLALHYRAAVNQSTGEDWTEAILILSTASPDSLGSHIPRLASMKITPKQWGGIFQNKQQNRNVAPNPFNPGTQNLFGFSQQQQQPQLPAVPFGAAAQQQPQQAPVNAFGTQQPATALFGSSNPPVAGVGLFGQAASIPPTAVASTSLFAAPTNPAPSAAPTSIFGSSAGPTANPPPATEDFVHVAPDEEAADDPEALPEMEIPSAATKENSMAANFEVKGNANIRSDGSNHKVAIAVLNFDAKIQTVAVPRSVPGANLHVRCYFSAAFSKY
jgi:hypothetical protein